MRSDKEVSPALPRLRKEERSYQDDWCVVEEKGGNKLKEVSWRTTRFAVRPKEAGWNGLQGIKERTQEGHQLVEKVEG